MRRVSNLCLLPVLLAAGGALAQTTWTTRNPSTPLLSLNTAAWTGNLLVMAGDSGVISTSPDAGVFTNRASGVTNVLQGLTGNNTLIVAVGQGGAILTSPNGTTWTSRASGTSNALRAVSFSSNLSLHVAAGAAGTIVTSTNPTGGAGSWVSRTSGTAQALNSIDNSNVGGNNLFVAVGDSGVIFTSTTGTNNGWTFRTSGTVNPLRRVRFANTLWVAIGDSGTIRTSGNGTTNWATRSSNTTVRLSGLQYGNGLWVAVGDSGVILTSTSGTMNWTARASGTTASLREVAWTNNTFVAVGAGGVILTSANGIDWTRSSSSTAALNGLTWNGSQYTVVGAAGTTLHSATGSAWTTHATGSANALYAADTTAGLIVAVGNAGTILTSPNGATWTSRSSGTTQHLYAVRRGGGRFVAVGVAGTILTSSNGLTWTSQASGTTNSLYAVEWTGTQYVASGANGTILASADGTFWSARNSGVGVTLYSLCWTGTRLIASGMGGTILISTDGATWEAQTTGTTSALYSLACRDSRVVAVGASGTVISSPNGVTWASHASGTTATLNAVHWNGSLSQYAAVGPGGLIITAPATTVTAPTVPVLLNPAQNATGVTATGLAWNGSGAGAIYHLQLSTVANFATLVRDDTGLTATTRTGGPYTANTVYYWRVRARVNGYTSYWSEVFSFSTGSLPAAPTPLSPAHATTGVPLSTTLQWGTVTGALAYRVQLSVSPSFETTLLDDSTVSGLTRDIAGLSANAVYYWRVSAKNASGTGSWSATRSFTTVATAPAAPALVSPANAATSVSVFAALSWTSVQGATAYRVQLSLDSGFTAPQRDDSSLTGTTWSPPVPFAGSTVFYWRAQARNPAGVSAWTAHRRFTTAPTPTGPPPAPVLSTPAQYAAGVAVTSVLSWNTVIEASRYRVQLSTSPTFATILIDDSAVTAVQKSPGTLTGNTAYYWRVSGANSFGLGPWSETWTFTTVTVAPTVAPVLSAPAQFATGIALPAALSWEAVTGAATYRVQVSATSDFAAIIFQNTAVTGTSVSATGLAGNTDYYWRVAASNTLGTGPYSSIRRFTTATAPLPTTPVLTSPANFTTGVLPATVLYWEAIPVATTYRVQISLTSDFAVNLVDDSSVTAASRTIGTTMLAATDYYWRVRAKNSTGVSAWSSPWRFTAISIIALLPGQVTLARLQGVEGDLIRIGLPHRGRVVVGLRDMRGRVTDRLFDGVLEAGYHVIPLPRGMADGVRLLDLRTDGLRKSLILQPGSF